MRRLLTAGASGREVPLGSGWRAELVFDRLRIVRGSEPDAAGALALTGQSGERLWGEWRITWRSEAAPARQERVGRTAWFHPDPLIVRPWAPGDKLRPLAGIGRRLVVRCFQDARVPRRSRRGLAGARRAGSRGLDPGGLPVRRPPTIRWSGGAACRC